MVEPEESATTPSLALQAPVPRDQEVVEVVVV
jgi:hypothetical protein